MKLVLEPTNKEKSKLNLQNSKALLAILAKSSSKIILQGGRQDNLLMLGGLAAE